MYALFLIFSRPYDDTIFQTYEIITSTGQIAMMIVVMLGFYGIIEAPTDAFIGIIAFIMLGQVGNQVCVCVCVCVCVNVCQSVNLSMCRWM